MGEYLKKCKCKMYVDYKVFRTLLLELRHVRTNMITLYQF